MSGNTKIPKEDNFQIHIIKDWRRLRWRFTKDGATEKTMGTGWNETAVAKAISLCSFMLPKCIKLMVRSSSKFSGL